MAYLRQSRYASSKVLADEAATESWFGPHTPFRFRQRADTRMHIVTAGETWHILAARYFTSISTTPRRLWWVIAEFQPEPVVDPTLRIAPGTAVFIPHPSLVQSEVLAGIRPGGEEIG